MPFPMEMEALISLWVMNCSPRCRISYCTIETVVWNPCRPSVCVWAPCGLSPGNPLMQVAWKRNEPTEGNCSWSPSWKFLWQEHRPRLSRLEEVLRWSSSSLYLQGMFLSQLALTSTLTKYVRNWLITNPFPSPSKEEIKCDPSVPALVCIFRAPRLWISSFSVMLPINSVDKVWTQVVLVWRNWWKTSSVLGVWQHFVGDGAGYYGVMIYKVCVTLVPQAQDFIQLSFSRSWLPGQCPVPRYPTAGVCWWFLGWLWVPLSPRWLFQLYLCPASFPSPLTAATAALGE